MNDLKNIYSNDKICFIVLNPYFCQYNELGEAVLKDGNLIENIYKNNGYKCFKIIDESIETFKNIYSKLLSLNLHDLIIYYSGHGTQIDDKENSEEDGLDECLLFKDGLIVDDYLSEKLHNTQCQNILFIFDCCHSGTLIDNDLEIDLNKITSISGCKDSEFSVQFKHNGIFTYNIDEYKNLSLKEIIEKTNKKTKKYNQHIQMCGNRKYLFIE